MRLTVPYFEQKNAYSCGPAVLKMVLAYFGIQAEQDALVHLVTTSPQLGTPQERMARVAREYGFGYLIKQGATLEDISLYLHEKLPVIVNFIEPDGNEGHYGLVVGKHGGNLFIHDPWNGPNFKMNADDFLRRWRSEHGGRWRSILELVRTHFSEKIPPRKFGKAAEPHR